MTPEPRASPRRIPASARSAAFSAARLAERPADSSAPAERHEPTGGDGASGAAEPRSRASRRSPPETGKRPSHLPGLDGLRGIAVVAVVAYHLDQISGGFAGVDLFFVLSGFLITRLLIAERARTGTTSLRGFWARRLRRLMPAMLITAAASMVASRMVLPSWRLPDLRFDALAAIGHVANWRFVVSGQSYFASSVGPSPLRHTWSLAVEQQFYVLWPLLAVAAFTLLGRSERRAAAIVATLTAIASAGWMVIASLRGWDPNRLYYGTDTRIFAMAIGAFVSTWFDPLKDRLSAQQALGTGRWSRRGGTGDALLLVGLLGLGIAFLTADEAATVTYRGGLLGIAIVSAVAIVGASLGGPIGDRLLGRGPFEWLGVRSYGIYLYSWPTQILVFSRLAEHPWSIRAGSTIVITLVLAAASYRWVEAPVTAGGLPFGLARADRGTHPPRLRPLIRPVAFVSSTALAVTVVAWSASGAEETPDFMTIDDRDAVAAALSETGFSGEATRGRAPAPTAGTEAGVATAPLEVLDPGPNPPFDPAVTDAVIGGDTDPSGIYGRPLRLLILGDSVAWSVGFEQETTVEGMELSTRAIIGCGVMPIDYRWIVEDEPQPYGAFCPEQAEAEDLGFASNPDAVLMWLGAWEVLDQELPDGTRLRVGDATYGRAIQEAVQARIDRARAIGAPVLLVEVPCFGPSEPLHGRIRTDLSRVSWVNEQIWAVAARNPGWVRVLEPGAILCDGEESITQPDGTIFRPDGAHFTRTSALLFWERWLAGAVGEAFEQASPTAGS